MLSFLVGSIYNLGAKIDKLFHNCKFGPENAAFLTCNVGRNDENVISINEMENKKERERAKAEALSSFPFPKEWFENLVRGMQVEA